MNRHSHDIIDNTDCTRGVNADTGHAEDGPRYTNLCTAVRSVLPSEKRRAFMLLGACGVTLSVLFLSRLIWLFKPLFAKVYYGTLSVILYYSTVAVIFTVFVVLLGLFLKRKCGERIFLPRRSPQIDVPRALSIIALSAAVVFFISAGFDFKVKIQIEMGSGVTMAQALTNISVYVYYALHLWLGLIAAEIFGRAMNILVPTRYAFPWAAVFLVMVFGLTEFALEVGTTFNLYPWIYYLLTYVYAAVYELTNRSFHLTYWTCVIIMVL